MPVHVLVAEDEFLVAMAVEELLVEAGYRVTVTHNGLDALKAYATDPADILLTDVRMPKLGGLELVDLLRAQRSDLPVVIMSGHLVTSAVMIAPSAGRTAVFTKPVPSNQLLEAVRASLA